MISIRRNTHIEKWIKSIKAFSIYSHHYRYDYLLFGIYMCRFTSSRLSISIDNAIELLCMHHILLYIHTDIYIHTQTTYPIYIWIYRSSCSLYYDLQFAFFFFPSFLFTPFIHTYIHIVVLHLHNLWLASRFCNFSIHTIHVSDYKRQSHIEFDSRSFSSSLSYMLHFINFISYIYILFEFLTHLVFYLIGSWNVFTNTHLQ